MSDNTTSSAAPTKPEVQSAPAWGFGVIIALILVLALVMGVRSCNEKRERNQQVAAAYVATHTSAPTAIPVTPYCQGSWDIHELDIPAGGLPMQLCWGWSAWSISGPVTLTTKSGKVYRFLPGKEGELIIPELQMGGMAIFRADPDGASRRIAVKNRW